VVRVVNGQPQEHYRQEQAVSHRAATAWEELAIGLTAPVDGTLEVWVENTTLRDRGLVPPAAGRPPPGAGTRRWPGWGR
jgi:hypothetical protein